MTLRFDIALSNEEREKLHDLFWGKPLRLHQMQELQWLVRDLASSWPVEKSKYSKYMPKRDIETLIKSSSESLEECERRNEYGNFPYMYTKLKLHADYHGLDYSIPPAYEEACEQKKKEMIVKWWQIWS